MYDELTKEDIKKMQEENLDLDECLDFMQLWYRDILIIWYSSRQRIPVRPWRRPCRTAARL